jgi:tetratricopeptide (TPR) repeat protein
MSDSEERDIRPIAETLFLQALECMRLGENELAERLFKEVAQLEPRVPEPHLELAVLAHQRDDLEEAIERARLGLELLRRGGQWTKDLTPDQLLAHAENLLGELLVEAAQQGDTPFDKPAFAALWNEAVALFQQAAAHDPEREEVRVNAKQYKTVSGE